MSATGGMAIPRMMMIVGAFGRDEPLDALCSTITLRRTYSSSSFGGTDMLHLASKRGAIGRQMSRGPGEDRDGQAAQRRGKSERSVQAEALPDGADAERAGADPGVEGQHDRTERPRAAQRV